MINYPKNMVVVSPHPDDETLGTGGTIAKFSQNGTKVSILENETGIYLHFMKIKILKLLKRSFACI